MAKHAKFKHSWGDIQVDIWIRISEGRPGLRIKVDVMEYYSGIKSAICKE